jgi:putative DNA primase/helicase
MNAEDIAKALGGRRIGDRWIARCPAHDDHKPSFSVGVADDGNVLVHCHAGCDQERVIAILRARGLWMDRPTYRFLHPARRAISQREPDNDQARRARVALAIWQSTMPAEGTLVTFYLASRGLHFSPPTTLRFHCGLKHPAGGVWPAMVALVTRGFDGMPLAIHRTFLARDGAGKAPVDPSKMMLGACRGGVVRLATPRELLMVGEGIETCLAAMLATGHPAWAALSTSGLRALDLPNDVRDVIVLADGDDAGLAAARDCALRWKRQGRRVRIAQPPQGMDFNDMLMSRSHSTEESAQ